MIQKFIKEMSQKTKKHTKYTYFISNRKCKENSNILAALIGKNWKYVNIKHGLECGKILLYSSVECKLV